MAMECWFLSSSKTRENYLSSSVSFTEEWTWKPTCRRRLKCEREIRSPTNYHTKYCSCVFSPFTLLDSQLDSVLPRRRKKTWALPWVLASPSGNTAVSRECSATRDNPALHEVCLALLTAEQRTPLSCCHISNPIEIFPH